ncbi:hypothetical protein TIFTF001_042494 [Ficus carica]|uniref:Uncharacterized protein n=1 Tax=Ficus carica TaxID=3494 RepID=A0AA87ZNT6_FICCA|nr:hypothetical protein TIFTF001_042494 [Ficus carica]
MDFFRCDVRNEMPPALFIGDGPALNMGTNSQATFQFPALPPILEIQISNSRPVFSPITDRHMAACRGAESSRPVDTGGLMLIPISAPTTTYVIHHYPSHLISDPSGADHTPFTDGLIGGRALPSCRSSPDSRPEYKTSPLAPVHSRG